MATSNDDILREFLLETHENLLLLDSDLIALEKNPTEKSTLAQVFRTLHSVKGTAGFMGLEKLQAVAHAAESLLSRLRAGDLLFDPTIATALLRTVDAVREILASIESDGGEGTGDYTALQAELDRLRTQFAGSQAAQTERSLAPTATSTPEEGRLDVRRPPEDTLEGRERISDSIPEGRQHAVGPVAALVPPEPAVTAVQDVAPSVAAAADTMTEEVVEPRVSLVADSNIRVDVGLLDNLMTLVGELVLARNQILQYSEAHEDDGFLGAVQRLNLLTTELQSSVMKTRMQPIGNVLNKFPRIVRDLALACGKKVRFEMEGQETELDKTLIESIRDPLTHIVRNAIDHGFESPDVRISLGKSEEGRLRMDARHEGGKVIVEISDDGSGIDANRVRDKAIAANLVSPEAAARMSRQELLRLIFLPGFSTSDRVTQFSGRGVGMDVVRTNIEKIGGVVDLESVPGQGTTIRAKIPLTLAIIPALIVVGGDERYAIPQVSLLELMRIEADDVAHGIERVQGAPVYRLRGALLPLVFLDEQLQLAVAPPHDRDLNIVVVQADDRPFGLVVDAIRDTEEIVVKPLQKQLKGIGVFAGAAIMGDGRVALVLDVLGLAQRAKVISGAKSSARADCERSPAQDEAEIHSLLCFEPRDGGQMAIPLERVTRLEEFSRTRFERLGDRQVIQYRGGILPLVDVSRELRRLTDLVSGSEGRSKTKPHAVEEDDAVPVVVCEISENYVGLVVGRILDIVDERIPVRSRASRPGVSYTAVVQSRVTEFIDVDAIVRDATTNVSQPVA